MFSIRRKFLEFDEPIRAEVIAVFPEKFVIGKRKPPYAFAVSKQIPSAPGESIGTITFSLTKNVWKDDDPPLKGQIVHLEKVILKKDGDTLKWRARLARPWVVSHERKWRTLSRREKYETILGKAIALLKEAKEKLKILLLGVRILPDNR